ncbi:MAG: LPS export ABC transporter periplasmic protein LptC [Flavobacteriaceae bacterium]|nr:LPS export ABC transporter periplasmic protein LptC [Flavobacteriaceae bacterium]
MTYFKIYRLKSIVGILLTMLFISCTNDIKEVRDFLADKNLPIAVAKNINLIHTDSGRVKTKLKAPLLYDYSNRKYHPYQEFPNGLKLISFQENGDSVLITADYGKSFIKTNISEIIGNVEIFNFGSKTKLNTEQLYWDQNLHYFFTENKVRIISGKDTTFGKGFEAKEDLTKAIIKNTSGTLYINENK